MRSLHLPLVDDMLAMVSAPGLVMSAEDPVIAYAAMRCWFPADTSTADEAAESATFAHLQSQEVSLGHARDRVARAVAGLNRSGDLQSKALELAEVYLRLVEGPVRQYGWAIHARRTGRWTTPPMVTQLRETLVAAGGWLGWFAGEVVLRDLRNAVAHGTAVWDGIAQCFEAEGSTVPLADVLYASMLANSFTRGCEAALAVLGSVTVDDPYAAPSADQSGPGTARRRARSYFGTNGLRVVDLFLNSNPGRIVVERLDLEDINPLFQALILTHRLAPAVDQFTVSTPDTHEPLIEVSAAALEANDPIWRYAMENLSAMPLSAFLPANLDARRRVETEQVAARSVAWIAADDFLSAVDLPSDLGPDDQELFAIRTQVVRDAVRSCLGELPSALTLRAGLLLRELDAVASQLPLAAGLDPGDLTAVARIRLYWDAWGPVARHPKIATQRTPTDPFGDAHPALRVKPPRWARL